MNVKIITFSGFGPGGLSVMGVNAMDEIPDEIAVRPRTLELNWRRCGKDQHWCDLLNLNTSGFGDVFGVYVIWCECKNRYVVRVGQGEIADRLSKHRSDETILLYKENGRLLVTFAAVDPGDANGVERFLDENLNPLVGTRYPYDDDPIEVNLPW